jgi:plastocyanin
LTLGVGACGGGYGNSSPFVPSSTPPPSGAITINVVRQNGNQSFSPNPATVPAGQTVVWHNIDTTAHRVVLNDGELDTGNLAPGAFSQPTKLGAPGPYHCSIHPDMVGTVANR